MARSVVILSGGLDSTVCMSLASRDGYELFPITYSYGQRHRIEVEHARKVAQFYKCTKHLIVDIDFFRAIGHSALTSNQIDVPMNRSQKEMERNIPVTYVPFRNAVFLSMAVGYAESIQAETVYIGVNALDYSGYPDCRPQFIKAFQDVVVLGTAVSSNGFDIRIYTPLISLTKAEIIKLGIQNDAPLHLTTSCYQGKEKACGRCDSCLLRLRAFQQVGIKDPILYEDLKKRRFSGIR